MYVDRGSASENRQIQNNLYHEIVPTVDVFRQIVKKILASFFRNYRGSNFEKILFEHCWSILNTALWIFHLRGSE